MLLVIKNPPANAGNLRDTCSIPGLGRSPGGRHGNPVQYSCLKNPMDRWAWQTTVHRVAKPQAKNKEKMFPRKVVQEEAWWKHQQEGVLNVSMLGSWPSNFRFMNTQNETWHYLMSLEIDMHKSHKYPFSTCSIEIGCCYFIGKLNTDWLLSTSWLSEGLVSSY